jgi:hypothetical protein
LIESEDSLLNLILDLGPEYFGLLSDIEVRFLSEEGLSILAEYFIPPESLWQRTSARFELSCFDSRIISGSPDIFREFGGKQFKLLWRGSRDGFGASQFHRRSDSHGNTLTAILDADGSVFSGFTGLMWESLK